MKYDNQWRPAEHHNRSYAPYQRHKLKNSNWTTPEEANAISKHYNHWRYGGSWYREPDWHLEKTLIKKYIGKPYCDFLKAWHDRTKSLRRQGILMELRYINNSPTNEPDSRDEFYVDLDGIICVNEKYRCWQKVKKPIKVIEKEVIKYNLKPEIHNNNYWFSTPFHDILFILRRYFSKTDYNEILAGGIPKDKFDRMSENAIHSGLDYSIDKFKHMYNAQLLKNNPNAYPGSHNWCYYQCFDDLFNADYSESIYRYIYPGTPEYVRITSELNDAKRKAEREYNQQNEEYLSNLLYSIEVNRKSKEKQENSIKISKHGFDENESFRGDEYHGQKRKKNKE